MVEYLIPCDNPVRTPLDLEKKVAITIYWLASTAEYRTVANLFGVGKTTVYECIHDVCDIFEQYLLKKYVSFPEGDELKEVLSGYEKKWGFANCAGAIDGCHIPIIAPNKSHGDYLNRKGWYSLIVQGLCDFRYIFSDVNIGWPGRVHDARVLSNSEIYNKGEQDTLFPNWQKKVTLEDKVLSLLIVLIADPAYPLRSWLLKPFTNKQSLSQSQKLFNYRLSSARMTIENSFGRLKGRWRCLQKRLDVDVEFACTVIAACIVLHNVCEMNHQNYDSDWDQKESDDQEENDTDNEPTGKSVRDDFMLAFAENALLSCIILLRCP